MIFESNDITCSLIRLRVPNKSHLKDDDIKNHPITDNNFKQIGRVLSADNNYIYCIITEGESLIKTIIIN